MKIQISLSSTLVDKIKSLSRQLLKLGLPLTLSKNLRTREVYGISVLGGLVGTVKAMRSLGWEIKSKSDNMIVMDRQGHFKTLLTKTSGKQVTITPALGDNWNEPDENLAGTASDRWKQAVLQAARYFPRSVIKDLTVDFVDWNTPGGFQYTSGRILIGHSNATPKHAIEHELSHRVFDMLSEDLQKQAYAIFGNSWIVDTHITKPYKHAETGGVWTREDKDYESSLIRKKRVREQSAEAIRCVAMRVPLPLPEKASKWARTALVSIK